MAPKAVLTVFMGTAASVSEDVLSASCTVTSVVFNVPDIGALTIVYSVLARPDAGSGRTKSSTSGLYPGSATAGMACGRLAGACAEAGDA